MDLEWACGGDLRGQLRLAIAELPAFGAERGGAAFEPSPEVLIRKDRER